MAGDALFGVHPMRALRGNIEKASSRVIRHLSGLANSRGVDRRIKSPDRFSLSSARVRFSHISWPVMHGAHITQARLTVTRSAIRLGNSRETDMTAIKLFIEDEAAIDTTLESFIADNEFSDDEIAEIRCEVVHARGVYIGSGGAGVAFAIHAA